MSVIAKKNSDKYVCQTNSVIKKMYAYFKIRYLTKDEYDTEEQVNFIRAYVEDVCKFTSNGFKLKTIVEHRPMRADKSSHAIILVKYEIRKNANISHIENIMTKHEVLDELQVFIAL